MLTRSNAFQYLQGRVLDAPPASAPRLMVLANAVVDRASREISDVASVAAQYAALPASARHQLRADALDQLGGEDPEERGRVLAFLDELDTVTDDALEQVTR